MADTRTLDHSGLGLAWNDGTTARDTTTLNHSGLGLDWVKVTPAGVTVKPHWYYERLRRAG